MKKTLSIIGLIVIFSIVLTIPNFAATKPEAEPLWDNIANIRIIHRVDGEIGTATGSASRRAGTTSAEGTLTVYKMIDGEWIYVDSWYKSTTGMSLIISEEFPTDISATAYKSVFRVTVYRGDTSESHTAEYQS